MTNKHVDNNANGTNRRQFVVSGGALIAGTALAGCLSGNGNGNGDGAATEVAIISSPAGFDDNAFNDNAVDGLEQASQDFDLEYTTVEETEEAQYASVQADVAESGYDLIICVGDNHTDPIATNVEEYPDQNWMLINNSSRELRISQDGLK